MGMLRGSTRGYLMPALQASAVLSQASPVSGTKYTVLTTSKNTRVIAAFVSATWTVQPNPLESHWTIDGQPLTASEANPASVTNFYVNTLFGALSLDIASTSRGFSFLLEGRSVKIEAEITGGTVQSLDGTVMYAKW